MKTKLLLALFLMIAVSFETSAQFEMKSRQAKSPARSSHRISPKASDEAGKFVYAFCGDEVKGHNGVGIDVELRAYIRIPARQWKGAKITEVEIGLGYEAGKDSYVFISKDMDKDPLVMQYYQCDTIAPVPDDEDYLLGWKKVPLDEPYVIDSDDDLYIGWYTIQQGYNPIGTDWDTPLMIDGNLVSFRHPGNEAWSYQKLDRNVSVRVTIEGDNLLQNHLRVTQCTVDQLYCKPGETVTVKGIVTNEGMLPVEAFDMTYQISDEEAATVHLSDVTIASMETYSFEHQVPVGKEGKKTVTLTATNPNGKSDEYPETTTTTSAPFGCMARGVQKTVLVEEVVGTDDRGAVAADRIIQDAIDNSAHKENIIWIKNHCLSDDEYTIPGYKNFEWLYAGQLFTPAVNIDHTQRIPGTLMLDANGEEVAAESEMFIIDENFGKHLEWSLADEEVYFSLKVECEVIDGDILKIKMKGIPAIEGLFPSILQPQIALLLMEDGIKGKQAGVDGEYIHNHIPRAFINDGDPIHAYLGDEIPIPAEGFTLETKYIIPDKSWNIDNLRLVFYLIDGNVAIRNSATCSVKPSGTGITDHHMDAEPVQISCINGMLHVDGEFDKAHVFTLSGQKVFTTDETDTNVSGLEKGVYCILIQKGNHFVSEKFMVR